MLYIFQLLAHKTIQLLLFSCILFFCFSSPLQAQDEGILPGETGEQPKDRETQITASVSDEENPSTPILVAPADESKLNISKPTFIWKKSTDNIGMSHYVFTLNGITTFDTIPLVSTDNSNYTLTYNATTTEYALAVKSSLNDGHHTWKITAVDLYDNQASSVTWNFSIDSNAPKFVITKMGDQVVEITSQDVATIPTTAVQLSENGPVIKGTGEINSDVELTVQLPNGSTFEYSFDINGAGNWEITLDTLPRDVVIYLHFVITDTYGNVSILSDVPLIIVTPVITIPIPTPPPGFPIPIPIKLPAKPAIIIPLVPPQEILPPSIIKLPKQITFYIRSHEATARAVTSMVWSNFWWLSVIALLIALQLLKLWILTSWWWSYLSGPLFKQMLWVIGWWRNRSYQGLTISRINQSSIGFCLVIVSGKTSQGLPYKDVFLSNKDGVFPDLHLPEGTFRVSVQHPLFFFPTLKRKPAHLNWNTYYTGSEFSVQNDSPSHLLVLVAEPLEYAQNTQAQLLRQHLLGLPALSYPLAILAGCLTLAFPSVWNILASLIYILLVVRKHYQTVHPNLELATIDQHRTPQENVVIALKDERKKQFTWIGKTDDKGQATTTLPVSHYLIWVIDLEKPLAEGDKRTITSLVIKGGRNYMPLVLQNLTA